MAISTYPAEAWDSWQPIKRAAPIIGCSDQSLRNAIAGTRGRPKLDSKEDRKLGVCVNPRAARLHLLKYFRVSESDLNTPPAESAGGASETAATTTASTTAGELVIDAEISRALNGADPMTFRPQDLALRLALAGVDGIKVKPLIQAVNSLQRRHEADARAGKFFSPEDAVKMLRSHAEIIVDLTDERSEVVASELLTFIRKEFGVDLGARQFNAKQLLENFFIERFGDGLVAAIRKLVEDQARGIFPLELS